MYKNTFNIKTTVISLILTFCSVFLISHSSFASSVSGTVKDDTGATIDNVEIVTQAGGEFLYGTTNASGKFTVTGLSAGKYHFKVSKSESGYATSHLWNIEVNKSGTTAGLEVEITKKKGTITGTIQDGSGKPVANAFVEGFESQLTGAYGYNKDTTDASGNFTLDGLPVGTYDVRVKKSGFSAKWSEGIKLTDGSTETITISMSSGTGKISGKITDTSQKGISGALVNAQGGAVVSKAVTGVDGSYTLADLVSGKYGITVKKKGYSRGIKRNINVTSGKTTTGVNIVLYDAGKSGSIAGTVTDSSTGKPIKNAKITANSTTGGTGVGNELTNNKGKFNITSLPPDTYVIYFSADGYASSQKYGIKVSKGKTATVNLKASDNVGAITGKITDKKGKPLSGFTLFAGARKKGPGWGNGRSDSDGKYAIENLPPQPYNIHVPASNSYGGQWKRDVKVASKKTNAGINFQLVSSGLTISGKVKDSNNRPLKDVKVEAFEITEGEIELGYGITSSDKNGNFKIKRLLPGEAYRIFTDLAGYKTTSKTIELKKDKKVIIKIKK